MWTVCGRERARAREKVLERERERGKQSWRDKQFYKKQPCLKLLHIYLIKL